MGLADYGRALVRGWWLLLVGLGVCGVAAGVLLQITTPLYQSDTQLLVSSAPTNDPGAALSGSQYSQGQTATLAQLIVGRDLAGAVVDDIRLGVPPREVQDEISATVIPNTTIIDVTVTDPSAERAHAIASSVGRQFAATVARLEAPSAARPASLRVDTVAQPSFPSDPASPDPLLYLVAGCLGGLVLGGAAAVVRDRLDTRISDEQEAAEAAGAPVLGLLPDHSGFYGGFPGEDALEQGSPATEAIRIVRSNLRFVSVGGPARVLVVTSAEKEEGKTTTAIRLAQALSQSGLNVVLVEADLRRPRVTRYLGVVGGVGVTNLLTDTAVLDDVLQPVGRESGLTVLGAGPKPPNPSELLGSQAMGDLLGALTERFDVVLVDSPPLLPVADAFGLAALADGVLLCVRWGKTDRASVERARVTVERTGTRMLGVVLTFVPGRALGGHQYGYAAEDATPRGIRRLFRPAVELQGTPFSAAPAPAPSPSPSPERLRPAAVRGASEDGAGPAPSGAADGRDVVDDAVETPAPSARGGAPTLGESLVGGNGGPSDLRGDGGQPRRGRSADAAEGVTEASATQRREMEATEAD